MTLKNKLVFEEKSILSEMLEDTYLQVVTVDGDLYFLLMSELSLTKNIPIECNISKEDGIIYFNNVGNNIDKLTNVSLDHLLGETEKASGSVINYEVDDDEINELNDLINKNKKIIVINFIVNDFDELEEHLQDECFDLIDGEEYLLDITKNIEGYGISKDQTKSASEMIYEIGINSGLITPFYFIKDLNNLKHPNEIKLPKYIKEVNTFTI